MQTRAAESQAKNQLIPAKNEVLMNKWMYTVKH
jgi:hypothetical protein